MALDIGLGCLTLHMEQRDWLKGIVDDKRSDIYALAVVSENNTPRGDDLPA